MVDATKFYDILRIDRDSSNFNSVSMNKSKYTETIKKVQLLKNNASKKGNDYKFLKRYAVLEIDGVTRLINPSTSNGPTDRVKYFVYDEELFEILNETHISNGHVGRDRMMKILKAHYQNITYRDVQLFLSLCESCSQKQKKKGIVAEPMLFQDLISRCQVNFIDYQSQSDEDCCMDTESQELSLSKLMDRRDSITVKEESGTSPTSSSPPQPKLPRLSRPVHRFIPDKNVNDYNEMPSSSCLIKLDENEFDAFGRNVSLQLQQLPLEDALDTQEIIQRVLRQQRLKDLKNKRLNSNSSSTKIVTNSLLVVDDKNLIN